MYIFLYHIFINKTLKGFDAFIFIKGDPIGHLWYVYTLIQIYILLPFLQKMLDASNQKQLKTLLITFLIISRGITILTNCGLKIGFSTDLIGNCALYFVILGYYLYKYPIKLKKDYLIYIVMFINMILIYYALGNSKLVNGVCNLSFVMVIGVICYISIFDRLDKKIKLNKITNNIISFVGKRTFGIYIIHMSIFEYMINHSILSFAGIPMPKIIFVLIIKSLLIFAIGLVIAIFMDYTVVLAANVAVNKVFDKLQLIFIRLYEMCISKRNVIIKMKKDSILK